MIRKTATGLALTLFLLPILMAQGSWGEGERLRRSRGSSQGVHWLTPARSFRTHVGIFPVVLPRQAGTVLFLDHLLFHTHQPTRVVSPFPLRTFPSSRFFFPGYFSGGFGGISGSSVYYSSRSFVEAWKDLPVPDEGESRISRSLVLSEGMEEEKVVQVLGSPLSRIRMGERQVWKYSGYSLLFVDGKLREIR